MSYHIIALLTAIIAGLAGASLGGPLGAFTGFVSIFATLAYVGPQNAAYRALWQTDISYKIRQYIAIAIHAAARGIVDDLRSQPRGALSRSITGSYSADRRYIEHMIEPPAPQPIAYTGETIRLDRS